ncbi:SurA N-terminal domain-containing protein [Pseudonocardia sp. RS010]|uniref:SurA N-terminal domain-containing protein n=1 Tax=Pseudonocardia sp. RS010 TaxID=3385979 RepID=UPI0039A3E008
MRSIGRPGRIGRVIVGVCAVAAVAAGCGSGPSQVGSALIVEDRSVALAEVQNRIDTALAHKAELSAQSAGEIADEDVARYVVSTQVTHELVTAAAVREGITVGEDRVDAALADPSALQLDRALFEGAALRERARDRLLAIALAEKYVDGLAVTADLVAATSQVDAEEKARALAAGGERAREVLADPRTAQAGQTYRAATDPDTATTVLFGTPAGQTVAFQPAPGQGVWLVLHVTDRVTDAPAEGPPAAATIDQDTLAAIGERLTQPDAGNVQVNPRYGVWDPVRMRVVAEGQQAGTVYGPGGA